MIFLQSIIYDLIHCILRDTARRQSVILAIWSELGRAVFGVNKAVFIKPQQH